MLDIVDLHLVSIGSAPGLPEYHLRCGAGRGRHDRGAKPSITGIHHFSPTVTDVEASVAWYQRLFGMDRVPVPFPHYEREDTGYAVVLIEPRSGVLIGLHKNEGNRGERFDECHTGLDHCSFGVASRDELAAWVARLDKLGIQHTGIRDEKNPSHIPKWYSGIPTTSSLSSSRSAEHDRSRSIRNGIARVDHPAMVVAALPVTGQ